MTPRMTDYESRRSQEWSAGKELLGNMSVSSKLIIVGRDCAIMAHDIAAVALLRHRKVTRASDSQPPRCGCYLPTFQSTQIHPDLLSMEVDLKEILIPFVSSAERKTSVKLLEQIDR